MKRYGVFVFYDPDGKVNDYVFKLLEEFKKVINELTIIINGNILSDEKKRIEKYSNTILIRTNQGYDAGAYKDFFLSYSSKIDFSCYDELVLFNDTFYGPFFSWEVVFETMKGQKADFWGLTTNRGGKSRYFNKILKEHIQSYFICIRKSMFSNSVFSEFWEKLEYPRSFKEAVLSFEEAFSVFFNERGFSRTSLDQCLSGKTCQGFDDMVWMIQNCGFPIIKRKDVTPQHYIQYTQLIRYLQDNTCYDVKMIEEDFSHRCEQGRVAFDPTKMKSFCHRHKNIFLFGAGAYASSLALFLKKEGIEIKGNIVTNMESGCITINELRDIQDVGIILAVNYDNMKEVLPQITCLVDIEQLFIPDY